METGGCGALTVVWDTSHGGGGGQVGIRTRQSCFQPKNHVYEFIRFVWWLKSKRVWCTSCCQIHREGDVAQMRKQQRSMMKCVMKSYFSPQSNFPGFDLNSGISHNVAASCFLQNRLAAFFFFFSLLILFVASTAGHDKRRIYLILCKRQRKSDKPPNEFDSELRIVQWIIAAQWRRLASWSRTQGLLEHLVFVELCVSDSGEGWRHLVIYTSLWLTTPLQ